MQKTKLVTLLKTFSKQEMKDFEKFISSPYFSDKRNLKPLFNVLKKYHPAFSSPHFTEVKIFKKLYPRKNSEKKKSLHSLQVLVSEMAGLAEKFLVYNGFETGKFDYYFYTCLHDEYVNKQLLDPALKAALLTSKLIDDGIKMDDYYRRRLDVNSSLNNIFLLQMKPRERFEYKSKDMLYVYADLFNSLTAFHNAHHTYRVSYNFVAKGWDLVMHFLKSFDAELFDKECDEDDYETKNLTLINYYYLKSHIDDNPNESILKAYDIYINTIDNLSRHRKYNIFILLLNIFVAQSRYDSIFIGKADELIDLVWGKGTISHYDGFPIETNIYLFILQFKIRFSGGRDVIKFVNKYSDKTDPVFAEGINNISKACIYFKEKSFSKCIEQFSKSDSFSFPDIKLFRYKLKICCLYELSNFDVVLSVIDSFEHFTRKNKNISDSKKNDNFKFIDCIKKLIKIKLGDTGAPDAEMKEILEFAQNLDWRYWFKEKVEELEYKKASGYSFLRHSPNRS